MTSRIRWFGLGATVGTVIAMRVNRQIRSRIAKASPTSIVRRATAAAKELNSDLRESIDEGLETMRSNTLQARSVIISDESTPPPNSHIRPHKPRVVGGITLSKGPLRTRRGQ